MKVTIRIKFFVVLLAFGLGPILISRGIVGRTGDKMVGKLSDDTRAELLAIVSTELQHNAQNFLNILEGRGQAMALGAYAIAQQAQTILEQPIPSQETGQSSVPETSPIALPAPTSMMYTRQMMSGQEKPVIVDLEHAAIHIPRGVEGQAVAEQVAQLNAMNPIFKTISAQLSGAAYSIELGLESGVEAIFPGRDGFHPMYDHRDRLWYTRTRDAAYSAWTTPRIDPTTRQAVATVGSPIRDANGNFLGAAAVDVPLSDMLGQADFQSRWSGDIRTFMVSRRIPEDSTEEGLLILAQQAYSEGSRHWRMSEIEPEWFLKDDPEELKNLMAAMKNTDNGRIRLSYNGEDSVLAFASDSDITILLVAPETVIAKLPNAVADSLTGMFVEIRSVSSVLSGMMLIITGFIAWFGSRAVIKPLLAMAREVKRLTAGDFSARIDLRTNDERDIFINAFNDMGPKLKKLMLLDRDLELAQEVQRLLLPKSEPTLSGFDIAGGIAYCDETGGDYYDFIDIRKETGTALGVILGDVSGHGVPSALIMASVRGQLHSLSSVPMASKARIDAINAFMSRDMDGTGRFLTLFYLELTPDDTQVRWVRAGHDPAIRYTPGTDSFSELGGEGLALGVLGDYTFQEYETDLISGDILLLATDGVWEARNRDGQMFGKKRILAIIRENAHKGSESIRLAIVEAVAAFQSNGQEDDIAVVVIRKV